MAYTPHSALTTETYGNGLVHAVTYNNRLQPNEIKLGTSGAPASIVDLTIQLRHDHEQRQRAEPWL